MPLTDDIRWHSNLVQLHKTDTHTVTQTHTDRQKNSYYLSLLNNLCIPLYYKTQSQLTVGTLRRYGKDDCEIPFL